MRGDDHLHERARKPLPVERPAPSASAWGPTSGRWIEALEPPERRDLQRPAQHFATDFEVPSRPVSIHLHTTAHGLYEPFLNGHRITDHELLPGFTAYRTHLQVQTFDVTALLRVGANALGCLLSDGWWRGQHGIARQIDSYGPTTAFLAELHVRLASGETLVVGTDVTWRSTPSHILGADLVAGEMHDLRRRVVGWCEPGTDRSAWSPVRVADHGYTTLCPTLGPPVRRIEELPARSVTELAPGRLVVDFGHNSNGWVRLTDLGPAGTKLTLTYGEWLDPSGDVTQENVKDSPMAPKRSQPVPFQTAAVLEPRRRLVRVEARAAAARGR